MLSAAKHLCAHRDRPFAEFTLSGAHVLRVTSEGSGDERFHSGRSQANRAYGRSWLVKIFIGLGSASTGHWPINRRCANTLCAYEVLPMVLVKILYRPLPAV